MILAKLLIKLGIDVAELERDAARAERVMRSATHSMRIAGAAMSATITAPMLATAGLAVRAANEFNAGMANVASLSAEAAEKVAEWKPLVQDIAVSVGKSTKDMTAGLYQVVSAFGVADDTLQVLEVNARAAAAGLSTVADAINLTSAVTKAYGDTSAEAVQHVADLALRTVQLGQTTFPELAASIGRVTPMAKAAGVSMEELFATMATLTGVTGNAAEVATQMRSVLAALMDPTSKLEKAIRALGYESGQAMVAQLGFLGTVRTLAQIAQESGVPLGELTGRVEAQTLVLALAGSQAETYAQKLAAMRDAAGATDQAFAAQAQGINSVGFAMQALRVRAEVLLQRIGDSLLPYVRLAVIAFDRFATVVEGLIARFDALSPRTRGLIVLAAALAAALGPVLLGLSVLVPVAGNVATAFGALFTVGQALIGIVIQIATVIVGPLAAALGVPVAPILAIIALVGFLYLAWRNNWLGIHNVTKSITAALVRIFHVGTQTVAALWRLVLNWLGEHIWARLTAIAKFVGHVMGVVGDIFASGWNAVMGLVRDVLGKIARAVGNAMAGVAESIAATFDRLPLGVGSGIAAALRGAAGTIRGIAEGAASAAQGMLSGVVSNARGAIQSIVAALPKSAADLAKFRDNFVNTITSLAGAARDQLARIKPALKSVLKTIADKTGVSKILQMLDEVISAADGSAKKAAKIADLKKALEGLVPPALDVSNAVAALQDAGGGAVKTAETVKTAAERFQEFKERAQTALRFISWQFERGLITRVEALRERIMVLQNVMRRAFELGFTREAEQAAQQIRALRAELERLQAQAGMTVAVQGIAMPLPVARAETGKQVTYNIWMTTAQPTQDVIRDLKIIETMAA